MNYNTQTFGDVLSAANTIAQPFITNQGSNVYFYTPVLTPLQMTNRFGLNSPVWGYGGPDIGYVMDQSEPGGYQASVDCSGFVARVLSAVYPAGGNAQSLYANMVMHNGTLTDYITTQHPQPFPSAEDYANMFAGIATNQQMYMGWECVTCSSSNTKYGSLSNVKPGDILTYSLLPPSKDTGHVMVVAGIQELKQGVTDMNYWPTNFTEFTTSGLRFFVVTVYDASNVEHYNDSRKYPTTGIGEGNILLVADGNGVPLAFQFNKGYDLLMIENIANNANLKTNMLQTLAVGRGI